MIRIVIFFPQISFHRRNGWRWPRCLLHVQVFQCQQSTGCCTQSEEGPPVETSLRLWRWIPWRYTTLTWILGLRSATWSRAAVMAGWLFSDRQECSDCLHRDLNHPKTLWTEEKLHLKGTHWKVFLSPVGFDNGIHTHTYIIYTWCVFLFVQNLEWIWPCILYWKLPKLPLLHDSSAPLFSFH